MKFLIGLALLSVAFASPAVQPVELPEAPQPAFEDGAPEAIELPAAEMPEFELQAPSILPLFIPQEISRMLNNLGEIREDVQVADEEAPVDAVYAEDAEMGPEEPSPVNFVDNDQDVLDMGPVEPSPVNFVDNDEDVLLMGPEEPSPVNIVDSADIFDDAPEEPSLVNFVDNDEDVLLMGPEEPSPVNFVDSADIFDDVPEEPSPVNVVENAEEIPISPVMVAEGPFEAEDVMAGPYEGSPLNFVDNAEAPAEEIPYSPVLVVDGPNMLFAEEDHANANNNMEAFLIQMARAFDAMRQADNFMAPPDNPTNRFPDQPMLRML